MWSGSWAGQAIRKIHALATRGFAYYLKEAVRQYHGQYLVRELTDATHPRPSQAHLVAGFGKKDEEFPLSDSALRSHLQRLNFLPHHDIGPRPGCGQLRVDFSESHVILRAHVDFQPAPEDPGGGGEVDGGAKPAGGVAPAGIVLVDPGLAATSATKEAPHNLAIPRDTVEAWEREADELEQSCSKCDCRLASWRAYALGSSGRIEDIFFGPDLCVANYLAAGLCCALVCCAQPPCPLFWACCICNGCKDGSSAADAGQQSGATANWCAGVSYCHYLRSEKMGVIVAKRRHREQFLAKKHYSVCFGMDAAVGAP